jgi:hypothetical protein
MFNPRALNVVGYRALPSISALKGKIRGANIHRGKLAEVRRRTPKKMLVTMKNRQKQNSLLY